MGLVIIIGTGSLVYQSKKSAEEPMNPEIKNINVGTENGGLEVKVLDGEDDGDDMDEDGRVAPSVTPPPTPKPVQSSGITMSDVATHNTRTSCWSVISGGVYDLTSWIPNHPGGERSILSICGIDGTSKYNSKHGGQSKAGMILSGFKIGNLSTK